MRKAAAMSVLEEERLGAETSLGDKLRVSKRRIIRADGV